jgi:hypothetical protein
MANVIESLTVNPLPVEDSQGGALNLTRFTGLGAALITVLTAFDGTWERIFGEGAPTWARPVVIIAVIATFAVVAAADILARGYAAGRRGEVIPMPEGLTATYETPDPNEKVVVAAVRFRRAEDDSSEFLVVKKDKSTSWVGRDELDFPPDDG